MLTEAFIADALADRVQDMILVADADHYDAPHGPRILYCNAAFERKTGWIGADVVGQTPRILQTPLTDRAALRTVRAALERWDAGDDSAYARVDLLNQTRDGREYWVDLQVFPIWGPNGERAWASVQRDISDRIAREQNAFAAALSDWSAPPAAEALAARIAHDLRAPLNSVLGYADLLANGVGGELTLKHAVFLGEITEAAQHALRISDDLLNASAIRSGCAVASCETGTVDELLAPVLASLPPLAAERQITITAAGAQQAKLWCDPTQARRCLTNIVDNALSASEPGGVVTITADSRDDRTTLAVSDEGRGMTEAEVATARTPYGRGVEATTRGFGLGLPIAIELMRLQSGDLQIHSQPGVGTTISLIFNQAQPPGSA